MCSCNFHYSHGISRGIEMIVYLTWNIVIIIWICIRRYRYADMSIVEIPFIHLRHLDNQGVFSAFSLPIRWDHVLNDIALPVMGMDYHLIVHRTGTQGYRAY